MPYVAGSCDPKVIPLGTELYGGVWLCKSCDTGGLIKGNRIDVFLRQQRVINGQA